MGNYYSREISDKLNLHTYNFLCCIGNGISGRLFPNLLDSIRSVVINENKIQTKILLQKNTKMKEIKFVNNLNDLDYNAFDRVIFQYDFNGLDTNNFSFVLNRLVDITDNNGYVLITEIAHSDAIKEKIVNWLYSKFLFDFWIIENKSDRNLYDILIKVKK